MRLKSSAATPQNVTVFGQSAGGFDIAHLMAMPAATGAFDKAIPMSGSLIDTITKVEARAVAERFLMRFGGWDDPERMRGVSAEDLLDYQVELSGGGFGGATVRSRGRRVLARSRRREARIGAGIQTQRHAADDWSHKGRVQPLHRRCPGRARDDGQ